VYGHLNTVASAVEGVFRELGHRFFRVLFPGSCESRSAVESRGAVNIQEVISWGVFCFFVLSLARAEVELCAGFGLASPLAVFLCITNGGAFNVSIGRPGTMFAVLEMQKRRRGEGQGRQLPLSFGEACFGNWQCLVGEWISPDRFAPEPRNIGIGRQDIAWRPIAHVNALTICGNTKNTPGDAPNCR